MYSGIYLAGGILARKACVQQRTHKKQQAGCDNIHTKADAIISPCVPDAYDKVEYGEVHSPGMCVYPACKQAAQGKHQRSKLNDKHDGYGMVRCFVDPHMPDIYAYDQAEIAKQCNPP